MILSQWGRDWNIRPDIIEDLRQRLGVVPSINHHTQTGEGESVIQANVRLEASGKGIKLWRNNVGAGTLDGSRFVRFGLANESTEMNRAIKSSDLIGIRPIVVTSAHVGQKLGIFVARETKRANWVYRNTDRERAQLAFINFILSMGGDAAFANNVGTL